MRQMIRRAEVAGLRTGREPRRQRTRSELEDVFLALCRKHRVPTPEVNVEPGHREVDFLWREKRVIVETDGYAFHRGRSAFEDDHDRDLALRAAGYDVIRLTHRQLMTRSAQAMDTLKRTLADATAHSPRG